MAQQSSVFWTSLPGIITALGTLITAITGLYIAVQKTSGKDISTPEKPPIVVEQPASEWTVTPQSTVQANTSDAKSSTGAATTFHPSSGIVSKSLSSIKNLQQSKINAAAIAQLQSQSLVDCQYFPTVNTVKSLMSWSNHYHQRIVAANGSSQGSFEACKKTISYRAQAHCKIPAYISIRQSLFDTLSLCNGAGISWKVAIPQ